MSAEVISKLTVECGGCGHHVNLLTTGGAIIAGVIACQACSEATDWQATDEQLHAVAATFQALREAAPLLPESPPTL